jgi:cytochrome c556
LQNSLFYGFWALLFAVVVFIFLGCAAKEQSNKPAVKHMIQSEKLRILMRELDLVVYERQKSELERDKMRKRYVLTLADTLKKLSAEVENMPMGELGSGLTSDDFYEYKGYAKSLNQDANELYILAQNYEFELLSKKMEDIKVSCNSCHKQFRKDP